MNGVEDALSDFSSEDVSAEPRVGADDDASSVDVFRTQPSAPARSTHVRFSGALVFSVTFALLVVAIGPRMLETAGLSRWVDWASVARPPAVNPPPTFLCAADIPSGPPRPIPAITAAASPAAGSDLALVARPLPVRREATEGTRLAQPVVAATAATPAVTDAIESLVDRYLDALSAFDLKEVKALWPAVDETALRRAFTSLDEQHFELNSCDIAVAGGTADASCSGIVRYVPKAGTKTMLVQRRQWKFQLRSSNNRWFMDEVQSR